MEPVLRDLDRDGVLDLAYSNGDEIMCLSGQTGRTIYHAQQGGDAAWQPILLDHPEGTVLVLVHREWRKEETTIERVLLPSGKRLPTVTVPLDFGYAPFQPTAPGAEQLRVYGKYVLKLRSTEPVLTVNRVASGVELDLSDARSALQPTRWKGQEVLMYIEEFTRQSSQQSRLHVVDPVTFRVHASYALPGSSESRPQLLDVDGDGRVELLYGCRDGMLYCHSIPQ